MKIPSWSEITYKNDAGEEKVDFKRLKTVLGNSALEVRDSEICLPAVEHFKLFHDTTPSDKFVSFFFAGNGQKFQLNYTKKKITPQLLTIFVAFSKKFSMDLYLSEFNFITGKNRKESNVAATNVITLDLDKKNLDIQKELPVIQKICSDNGLNLSAVLSSGRGHYLVFKLDEEYVCATSMIQLNRWKHNYNQICDLFQEYEADYKCKDISRVFRLMGSDNHKDNTRYETKFLYQWDVKNIYCDIPICKKTIDDKMFENSSDSVVREKKAPKRKQSSEQQDDTQYLTLSENTFFRGQNKRRINDLIHLLHLRDNHLGDRHLFLYIMINQLNACGTPYKDALNFILEKVNPKFSLPESEYEISRQLQSIYKNNKLRKETIDRQPVEYVDNRYRPNTTEWIINALKITEDEQDKLSVLKCKDKLEKLRQERRLAKLRQHTQKKKQKSFDAINQMAQTHSIEEIAEATSLTTSSVYKKLKKTPKQIQTEKENAEILRLKSLGHSIVEISASIGLSYDAVKKRIQRLNKQEVEQKKQSVTVEEVKVEVLPEDIQQTVTSFSSFMDVFIYSKDSPPQNITTETFAEKP